MEEAVLVIDVQNEYVTGKLPVTYPQGSLENILMVMDHARDRHIPVMVIQHTSTVPDAVTFKKGTYGWELHDAIKQRHADSVIEKHLPGSFTGTMLDAWLRKNTISTITIAGYMSQMCCDTTARQAFHRGYAVNFLSDATGTLPVANAAGTISDTDLHRAVLVTQQQRFSRVLTTAEWMQQSQESSCPVKP
jgi:nicotinamidase-related amidase